MVAAAPLTRQEAASELLRRRQARRSVLSFAQYTHHKFVVGWHHRMICEKLEAVERGEIDRLMIFAPPRHGKSELVSVRFPAWYLGRNQHKQIMAVSYSDELASDFGRKVRNLVADGAYRRVFTGVELREDSRAAGRWHTTSGGTYVSLGIGGSATGRGSDILIIDDPFKSREEADSERIREKVWNTYESDLQSRLMPGGAIVLMHTRWHELDLAGMLLDAAKVGGDKWDVLELPAILAENTDKECALWPEWYSLEAMQRRRANTEARTWSALYQQRPQAEEGTFFKKEWFQRYRPGDQPESLNRYGTSDFAVTDGAGDYTEHGVWGVDAHDNLWALDWWYGQTASDVWIERQIDLMATHEPFFWFGEAGVIQKAISPALTKRMSERKSYCALEYIPSIHDKPTRARSFQARASMRKVYIPLVPWGDRLVDQLLRFPTGKNDDAVDACSLMAMAIDQTHSAVVRPQDKPKPKDAWDEAYKKQLRSEDEDSWRTK